VIPLVDQMLLGQPLHMGKVHDHAIFRPTGGIDHPAGQGDLKCIPVAVQMTALALVIRNAMTGIEFQTAGNLHGFDGNLGSGIIAQPPMPPPPKLLTVQDHSRASSGMTYVYPVVSRRAGGVSIGINLNPNNACNWHCIYCQVPDLQRGGPPPIDLAQLQAELSRLLEDMVTGDFLANHVPADQRRLVDIAFSGNGEPTSAPEFPEAVRIVSTVMAAQGLFDVKLRLITNGSLLDRRHVQEGIARIGAAGGEVWFKVDAGSAAAIARTNGVRLTTNAIERRLKACGRLCATWVQTCLFALDGVLPDEQEIGDLVALLSRCRSEIRGIHLYGLARPSAQAEAHRLAAAPTIWLAEVGARMEKTGLTVEISP